MLQKKKSGCSTVSVLTVLNLVFNETWAVKSSVFKPCYSSVREMCPKYCHGNNNDLNLWEEVTQSTPTYISSFKTKHIHCFL